MLHCLSQHGVLIFGLFKCGAIKIFMKNPHFNWFKFESLIFPKFEYNLVTAVNFCFVLSIFGIHSCLLMLCTCVDTIFTLHNIQIVLTLPIH